MYYIYVASPEIFIPALRGRRRVGEGYGMGGEKWGSDSKDRRKMTFSF